MDWDEIDPQDTSVIMNVYRAEVQRINTWRQRMDRTTNWAIVITVGVLTFSLSNPSVPHWAVLPGLFLAYVLLFTEARRYRHYDAWRGRVRALEEIFLAKFFDRDMEIEEKWNKILADDFKDPKYKMSWQEAVHRRLKRIYIWIVSIFLVAWLGKLYLHPEKINSWVQLFSKISGIGGSAVGAFVFFLIIGSNIASTMYFFFSGQEREAKGAFEKKEIDEKFVSEEYIEKAEEKMETLEENSPDETEEDE